MSGAVWTDQMVETLKQLWTQGLSARQIADHLPGITKNGVIGKSHRLGLDKRESPIKGDFVRQPRPPRQPRPLPQAVLARMPNDVVEEWRDAYSPEKVEIHAAFRAEYLPKRPHHRRPPTIVEVPMEQSPGYTLEEVQDWSGCLWPFGALKDRPTQWCGCTRAPGSSYCAHHHAMSRQRATGSIKAAEKYPGWAA